MTHCTIGIDISKTHLDVHRLPDGASVRFTNDTRGFRQLIEWLGKPTHEDRVERIVYEPTGAYHLDMEDTLAAAGMSLVKINPLHAKHFTQACGTRTKTDAVDAAMQSDCTQVPSPIQRDLEALQIARIALIKDRTATNNRAKSIRVSLLKRQNDKRLRQIESDLAAIDAVMLALIKADDHTARNYQIICSIPGIGAITAVALLVELPESGTLDAKRAASLAGKAFHRGRAKVPAQRALHASPRCLSV